MRYRGGARRSSGEDPVWELYRFHVTTVDTVDVQPAYMDGDAKRLDCNLDAVKTVDGPAVNQGYGITAPLAASFQSIFAPIGRYLFLIANSIGM